MLSLRKFMVNGLCVLALSATPCMAQTWQVNLQQADIGVFIQQVAKMTGKSFIVDPRVKGKVSVISNEALNEEAVYRLLLSVLTVHGYAALETADGIKVVPQNIAKQSGVDFDSQGIAAGGLLVTRMIPVKQATASELVPILRPLIPQYGHLAAVDSVNALIISDHADNIRELESLIARLDNSSEGVVRVLPLEHAWANDVLGLITELTGASATSNGSANTQPVMTTKVIADDRTNRMVIKGKLEDVQKVEALIKQLDSPTKVASRLSVLPLRYADAPKTAELIGGLLGSTVATDTASANSTIVKADEDLNALVVRADPSVLVDIQSVLKELDVPRAQVLVEAIIAEVNMDDAEAFGFQWLFGDTSDSTVPAMGTNFTAAGNSITEIATGIATGRPTLSNGLTAAGIRFNSNGDLNLAGILQAIESNSNANLLSTPKIMTLDNQTSKILVGETRPFQTGGYADSSSNAFVTTTREDIGLTLEVTPHINAGDEVRMEVLQIVEAASSEPSSLGTITTKREISTTVIAGNRRTIVLGGLIEDNVVEVQQKVPLLGDIPVIGALFRSTSQENQKRNLLVFIRPTILRSAQDVAAVTSEKFSGFRSIEISQAFTLQRPQALEERFDRPYAAPTK
ncbi:type II secretion system secretin GspD [Marinomonas fungiae]|uniref:Type II secretion system protein D n=1 Tax=Marinomonas fungiae TaxID=1137284 RepID=A0A0K6INX8_9GAMM|nr:type II secretion system secretin GspD [Marinomonas fungiae]CUB04820.1 type II secretion system protein D [Marinomonas fungiae]